MDEEFASQVSLIGALSEPTRRALYFYVISRDDAVSREQAADGVDVPLHTARFHLDRLVEEGLLQVEYRRLSGRTGPGAGRPSKHYRRSTRRVAVSLPERRYDLAGEILAEGIDRSMRSDMTIGDALREAARARGRRIAAEAAAGGTELNRTADVLSRHGYEPRRSGEQICLVNCPFDALARDHTELVCGMNLALVEGVLEGLHCQRLEAVLDPQPGLCCVQSRVRR